MKERPILFSAPMVRAILEGRKTQTRRIIKPQPDKDDTLSGGWRWRKTKYLWFGIDAASEHCPYGVAGDRLWVRETWAHLNLWVPGPTGYGKICYRADGDLRASGPQGRPDRWHPSIHMPRWASRITLEVARVRVERLKYITPHDAIAEGIEKEPGTAHWKQYDTAPGWRYWESPVQSYRTLWNSINGPDAWEDNPWVWVIDFQRIEK